MGKKVRLGSGFNVGGDQAEADPLLEEAFYSSGQYETMADRLDPRWFCCGQNGLGQIRRAQGVGRNKLGKSHSNCS